MSTTILTPDEAEAVRRFGVVWAVYAFVLKTARKRGFPMLPTFVPIETVLEIGRRRLVGQISDWEMRRTVEALADQHGQASCAPSV